MPTYLPTYRPTGVDIGDGAGQEAEERGPEIRPEVHGGQPVPFGLWGGEGEGGLGRCERGGWVVAQRA